MIKISIVVPVYNIEKYLRRCLNSILDQIFREIEIIIVNDESLNNSDKIIGKYKIDKTLCKVKGKIA